MKKIFIVLALLAGLQIANAQVKSPADAKKALDSALSDSQDAKKNVKAATWLKLGEAYVAAYDAPTGNLLSGSSKTETQLLLGKEQPTSSETVQIGGDTYVKDTYADKELYYNASDQLVAWKVTNPVAEGALAKAAEAYAKAYELDPKKEKDVAAGLTSIADKSTNEAYNAYTLGDYKASSEAFEATAGFYAMAPLSQVDTSSLYNAGFTAWAVKDNARALKLFKQCYDYGYFGEDGDLYAKLAQVDPDNTKAYLEEGFTKYPQSQSILIGLINYYMESGEDTETLFTLLDKAKANEPDNASLYYVEGNIRSQLGDLDKAIEAYEKCAVINPAYEYGYIGEGQMLYNKAIEVSEAAQAELDDKKYMALVEEFEGYLKGCIPPFEKAFEITKDDSIKLGVAEYLKNAFYRFRDEDPKYQTGYDKYSGVVSAGTAQ